MRIYVAAPWKRREEARLVAVRLEELGHTITEKWWLHTDAPMENIPSEELNRQANLDIFGVLSAELFIILNLERSEGKAFETGMAYIAEIPIIVVGRRTNLFHYLDGKYMNGKQKFRIVPSHTELFDLLQSKEVATM